MGAFQIVTPEASGASLVNVAFVDDQISFPLVGNTNAEAALANLAGEDPLLIPRCACRLSTQPLLEAARMRIFGRAAAEAGGNQGALKDMANSASRFIRR